ncbi:MAG: glycosyltransferase [Burkholderiales bacterium]
MRIVIDLQGAQTTGSRFRGIGRYSLALTQAMARNANTHEIWIALNGLFPDTIEPLRAAFDGLVPQERIVVWRALAPVAEVETANRWRVDVGEKLREAFLASLAPDVVHVTSLFEGFGDNALTSVAALETAPPVAITLYDLIPLVYRDPYLTNPAIERWYERKLGSLRRSQLWLAISESTRKEGIDWLQLPKDRVVNISTAAHAMFKPVEIRPETAAALRARYRLTRPFVMYTGGIDHRKNIEGLIAAYARLPPYVRGGYQLAIVCSASEAQMEALKRLAAERGLAADDVVLTGFIADADLVMLYNLCLVFVFPSWHEGFGLPALEAMSCGAAVIAANTSSLPEVIGRADALFDPHDEHDMAAKLQAVFSDNDFRQELRRHGLEQSKKFSWDNSARRALRAFERLHAQNQVNPVHIYVPNRQRPRLAYVSPLPPEKSGIADYSAELLPELSRHYDIDVIVDQPEVTTPWIRANCALRSLEWFDQNASRYDRILYQFGNSVFHKHMFSLLERHPGVVVLHDFFLSSLLRHEDIIGRAPHAFAIALYASHGYHAYKERSSAPDTEDIAWKYPANFPVLQNASGVIVHSEYPRRLADQWYGADFSVDWESIPLLRTPAAGIERRTARVELGSGDDDFLVCSFGMLGPTKLNHQLLDAWLGSPLAEDARCQLVFVGGEGGVDGANLEDRIVRVGGRIRITGFAPRALYSRYLAAADVAVQLRTLSRGETSAAVFDCMNYGVPTIANAHGAIAELPSACLFKLPDEFSNAELQAALLQLRNDPALRHRFGARAATHLRTHHHPRKVADQYRDAIERFAQTGAQARLSRLMRALAVIDTAPAVEHEWIAVAQAIVANHPPHRAQTQLLLDVSALIQRNHRTGIQRVVHSVLTELLLHPPQGFRVEPVYVSNDGFYRYARYFTTRLLGCPDSGFADDPIEATPGDIFLALDFVADLVTRNAALFSDLRRKNVGIYFVVYDLLPLTHPHCFPDHMYKYFSQWMRDITELGDGVVCISKAVANEFFAWLEEVRPLRLRPFKIGWFHLGANINAPPPRVGIEPDFDALMGRLQERTTVLMAGTVEPRKGHAQALAAFEQLWAKGVEANLAIVGKQGWLVETLAGRLRKHPQFARRLFWFEKTSDETLARLYETSDGLLMGSEGEGFGLPLIEAACHKLPILARDIPVFREIAGEHASYFSGNSADPLVDALQNWLVLLAQGRAPKSEDMTWQTWAQSARQLTDVVLGGRWHAQWGPEKPPRSCESHSTPDSRSMAES